MIFLLLACSGPEKENPPQLRCGIENLERANPEAGPRDGELRLNQVQGRGSHNSYHQAPDKPLDPSWVYTQPTLTDQLERYGVRQLELDLHLNDEGSLEVFHIPAADDGTSCPIFVDCLREICRWSAEHSSHAPLMIWLEPKDDVDGANGYQSLVGQTSVIEQEIRAVFAADQLYSPDEWKRGNAQLGEATAELGAPTLAETRGKVLFGLLDGSEQREAYLAETPDLSGRLLFPDTDGPDDSFAALRKDASPEETAGLLAAGLVVTSNVDSADGSPEENLAQRDAQLAGGVNFAASDSVVPDADYWMELPGGTPLRCNPVSASTGCASEDVEALK